MLKLETSHIFKVSHVDLDNDLYDPMFFLAAIWKTKVLIAKVGQSGPDNDSSDLI